jgi:hypothetical protein
LILTAVLDRADPSSRHLEPDVQRPAQHLIAALDRAAFHRGPHNQADIAANTTVAVLDRAAFIEATAGGADGAERPGCRL